MSTYAKGWCVFALGLLLVACGGSGSSGNNNPVTPLPVVSSSALLSSASSSSLPGSSSAAITTSSSSSANSSAIPVGLTARPANTACLAPATVNSNSDAVISWQTVFPALPNIPQATSLVQIPGDSAYWYALRQSGIVVRFANTATVSGFTTVLDIEDRVEFGGNQGDETGLLGIAFHPQFSTNPYVYLYFIAPTQTNGLETRVARYTVLPNGNIDRDSEQTILRFNQPYANHNGGQLAFGGDGYLYISSGDGGSGGDPQQNGQNKNNLLGKILRIDIDRTSTGRNYVIPVDNPFAAGGGAPEIWAYGLRNPWRFSFDHATSELWAGDVGQSQWEEINLVTAGGNYGWGDMEGDSCYSQRANCSTANKIKPVLSISHNSGVCSVIGGYVYRGTQYPAAYGKYFYTDYCVNTMQSITRQQDGALTLGSHGNVPVDIVSFAQDNQQELYALGQSGAGTQILKMQVTGGTEQPGTMANRLSATGCVSETNAMQPAAGMIPYNVHSELWADGAAKQRYLALPDNTQITLDAQGDFLFPVGTVLMKHFTLNNRFIETRLFTHSTLGWQGFSYEWLDDQSDAVLLSDGKDKSIAGITWRYPSPGQCLTCHTRAANFSLGLETAQLNGNFLYPASGINANQLTTLAHINLFAAPFTDTQKSKKFAPLADTTTSITERARSYLHSNCSGCHRPDGPTPVALDLRYATPLSQSRSCNVAPVTGDLGIANALLIAPGEPTRSVLLARMNVRDVNQMPTLGTHLVDADAVQLIGNWITGLAGCE